MKRARILILVLAVALAIAALQRLLELQRVTETAPTTDRTSEEPAEERPAHSSESRVRISEPEPAAAGRTEDLTATRDLEPLETFEIQIHGAAVRVEGGVEHPGDDGSFALAWTLDGVRERRDVEVLGGLWSANVPTGVELFVRRLVLADVPLSLENDRVIGRPERFVTLHGTARHDVTLRVVSASDGRALDQIEVWPGLSGFPTEAGHPGAPPPGPAILRGGSSPVTLPGRVDSWSAAFQYFVRAPGHAWGSIAIDHSTAGERELALEPSCSLEIELIGNADWLDPKVRLWTLDASQWDAYAYAERHADETDRARFEALRPGTYRASVERGWADRRESFGQAVVTLIPGEQAVVPIQLELPERPATVRVAGTLTIPVGWDRTTLRLKFGGAGATETWLSEDLEIPLGAMTKETGGPLGTERWAFEVDLPRPGSYRLEVFPLLVRRLLEVPAAGLAGLDIVVPRPARVEVVVLDQASGDEIPVDSLHWSTPHIDGIIGTPLYTGVADPNTGYVTFRAPAAATRISPIGQSLLCVDTEEVFELEPGPNRVELVVHRQIGVRFTFKDGDATVPWNWAWRLSAHEVDGHRRDRARSIGMLWFLEEGTYELRSHGIPGYRSFDGLRIDVVDRGEPIDVTIELERE